MDAPLDTTAEPAVWTDPTFWIATLVVVAWSFALGRVRPW